MILWAYGLTLAGQRTLLSFRQVTAENEATWTAFLQDLPSVAGWAEPSAWS